ncbi:unnamed protein product [Rotaria sp. Silwood2]|nr:unnamed protein product [Rotaria sp. Silwood2]
MASKDINNLTQECAIVWLDSSIGKAKGNLDTKAFLRRLVRGRLFTFGDSNKCVEFMMTELVTKRVLFIVSNAFSPDVVPLINELPYIQAIYIYCGNRQRAESWIKSKYNISGIFTKQSELLHKIYNDTNMYNTDNDLPMRIFHLAEQENTLQKLTEESATFMWYRSLLMVVRFMAKYDDFEKNYCPKRAFWWYTSDSFVYRLLNRALRTQDIEIIFTFRFFVNDLHNQIEQIYHQYLNSYSSTIENRQLTVYRGQRLSMTELDLLKRNENELISINSFFSTTLNLNLAQIFAGTNDQSNDPSSLQSVLFIIDINNITERYVEYILTQLPPNDKSIGDAYNLLGLIYKDTHQLEKSVECYEKALDLYSRLNFYDIPQVIVTRCNLGLAYLALGNSRSAEEQLQEAEEKLFKSLQSQNSLLIATVESLKAKIQTEYDDNTNALKSLQLVLTNKYKRLPSAHASIASTLNSIGIVYENMNNNVEACNYFQQALNIGMKTLPSDHLDLVDYHTNVGRIYYKQTQFKLALEQFQLARKIMEDYSRDENGRISRLELYINAIEKNL